jgi:hypothetical protein
MFDFRYHAVSLAAVLVALLVGLLLGIAIGDANLVSNAEKGLTDSLQSALNSARNEAAQLRSQNAMRTQYENAAFPALVRGRLSGRRIGLIFLGSSSDQVNQLVRSAIDPSGGQVVLVADVSEPVNLGAVAAATPKPSRYSALATDSSLLRPFAIRVGLQFARGGRLIQQVQSSLLSAYNGVLGPLDGVVLARNHPANENPADAQAVNTFESGLASGLAAARIPVVGVEMLSTNPSNISWYTQQNFASVDDLDDLAGRTALVMALAGNVHGAYGFKSTSQGVLPPSPAAPVPAGTP